MGPTRVMTSTIAALTWSDVKHMRWVGFLADREKFFLKWTGNRIPSPGAILRQTFAEAVVDFLSFSGDPGGGVVELRRFSARDWERTLPWLHGAGLALYFLQKLKQTAATDIVPASVLVRLEQNLAANKGRVAFISKQFDLLNKKFDAAGMTYAVVKGFALAPQFCPDLSLRHQSDCDYLVDEPSINAAMRILEEAGYFLQKQSPREAVYIMPSLRIPRCCDEQYDEHTAFAIELHRYMWDQDIYHLFLQEPRVSLENAQIRHWEGMSFQVLPEEDAFLIQVLHAFHHILTCWIRMSWLYEIGYFLNERATDDSFWSRVAEHVGSDPVQREIVVVVTALAAQFFRAPMPPVVRDWAENLRPVIRIWIANYARTWAFGRNDPREFSFAPTSKLALFLHREYAPDPAARKRLTRLRLLPLKTTLERLFRRDPSVGNASGTAREARWKKIFLRTTFHITSNLRYVWEIPRWRRLNRKRDSGFSRLPASDRSTSAQ